MNQRRPRSEERREARAARPYACVVILGASFTATACGASKPPPHVVEVPIDQFQAGPVASSESPQSESAQPAEPAPAESVASEAPSGGRPAEVKSSPPPAAGKPRPPRGQRLTASDCAKVLDRYAQLTGVSQGMSPAQAIKALPALRGDADAANPGFSARCVEENSKRQAQCALKSVNIAAWKGCLE